MIVDPRAFPAGRRERRLAFFSTLIFAVIAAGVLPVAQVPLPAFPAVTSYIGGAAATSLAITALLVTMQANAARLPGMRAMGMTFVAAAATVLVWSLVFPGVGPGALLDVSRPGCIGYLYLLWHAWLLAGVAAYRFSFDFRYLFSAGFLFAVAAIAFLVVYPLPSLVEQGRWTATYLLLVPPVAVAALALALSLRRAQSGLDHWLRLLCVAVTADLAMHWAAMGRYTVGWYGSRAFALFAATIVLAALLARIVRLYGELSRDATRLQHDAYTDALTGVPNRRAFEDRAAAAIARARVEGRTVTVALIDIDHFKRYNDRFGHVEGDACLRVTARILSHAIAQPGTMVARYGGEEFVALFEAATLDEATGALERARHTMRAHAIPHPDGPRAVVSFSGGVAQWTPGDSVAALVGRADAALYAAKKAGRDRIVAAERAALAV